MKTHALLAATGLVIIVGCGSSPSSSKSEPTQQPSATNPPPPDTTDNPPPPAPPPPDHGSTSTTYPAFTPEVGQIVDNGGAVLSAPVIVTVTWPGEPNADTFEKFGDALGPSQYWKAITSEYGVGAGTSGTTNHLRLTDAAPATLSDTDIDSFVSTQLSSATASPAWPAPTQNTVYILYIPTSTQLMLQGQEACSQGIGGYHDSTKTSVNGISVAYAVVPQCSTVDESTLSASHELAEAATDPRPQINNGADAAYVGFDDNHLAWEFFQQFQSEVGDACEFYRDSSLTAGQSDVPFATQRQWSNKSAAAGHDPCVPVLKNEVYFNTTPLDLEDVAVDLSALGGGTGTTKGYTINVGETRQVPIGFYSDAAKPAWNIKAAAGGMFGGKSSSSLNVSLDVTSGQNGQKAYLTVTVNTQGKTKAELLTIQSSDGITTHYMPLLISSPK